MAEAHVDPPVARPRVEGRKDPDRLKESLMLLARPGQSTSLARKGAGGGWRWQDAQRSIAVVPVGVALLWPHVVMLLKGMLLRRR
eukprot:747187-Hanusia_phi.AAC.2